MGVSDDCFKSVRFFVRAKENPCGSVGPGQLAQRSSEHTLFYQHKSHTLSYCHVQFDSPFKFYQDKDLGPDHGGVIVLV